MATIEENLQILIEQKAAIKAALAAKGKEPTEKLKTYAGLINELENEEQTTYVLTNSDGTKRAYAVKNKDEAITLTAQCDDIRLGSTAITNVGYTEGTKDIPAYHSQTGRQIIQAGAIVKIPIIDYDYTKFQATIAKYNTSINDSLNVYISTIDNGVYRAGTTEKIADITKDTENETINLGITVNEKSVLRYFTMREEA